MPLPVRKKNSCIAKPLYNGDENEFTSSKILFPSLHVHLGIINSLVDELEKVWPETVLWFLWLGLTRQEFHGKHFNVRIEQGRKYGKTVADDWAGAVMQYTFFL